MQTVNVRFQNVSQICEFINIIDNVIINAFTMYFFSDSS